MVDLHNDRAFCLVAAHRPWNNCFRCDLCSEHYHNSQFFFALWRPPYNFTKWPAFLLNPEQMRQMWEKNHYEFILNALEKLKELEIPLSANPQDLGSEKNGAFIGIEGAYLLNNNAGDLRPDSPMPESIPEMVAELKEKKVSYITLTWNNPNPYMGSHLEPEKGLTKAGEKMVRHLIDNRIMPDLSHASRKGILDFYHFTGGGHPLFFSHSNAYSLCRHTRNVDDEILNLVRETRGLMGINYAASFLNVTGNATGKDILKHIRYIIRQAGEESVSFGSDFDGWVKLPRGISNPDDVRNLFVEESTANENLLRKIFHQNARDFFVRNFVP